MAGSHATTLHNNYTTTIQQQQLHNYTTTTTANSVSPPGKGESGIYPGSRMTGREGTWRTRLWGLDIASVAVVFFLRLCVCAHTHIYVYIQLVVVVVVLYLYAGFSVTALGLLAHASRHRDYPDYLRTFHSGVHGRVACCVESILVF